MFLEILICMPVALFIALILALPRGPFHMDQGQHKGSFFPLLILYEVLGYFVAIASLIMAYSGKDPVDPIFLVAAIEAILFNGLLIFYYEGYLHSMAATGKSNYSTARQAMVLTFGISMTVTFVGALILGAL